MFSSRYLLRVTRRWVLLAVNKGVVFLMFLLAQHLCSVQPTLLSLFFFIFPPAQTDYLGHFWLEPLAARLHSPIPADSANWHNIKSGESVAQPGLSSPTASGRKPHIHTSSGQNTRACPPAEGMINEFSIAASAAQPSVRIDWGWFIWALSSVEPGLCAAPSTALIKGLFVACLLQVTLFCCTRSGGLKGRWKRETWPAFEPESGALNDQ